MPPSMYSIERLQSGSFRLVLMRSDLGIDLIAQNP